MLLLCVIFCASTKSERVQFLRYLRFKNKLLNSYRPERCILVYMDMYIIDEVGSFFGQLVGIWNVSIYAIYISSIFIGDTSKIFNDILNLVIVSFIPTGPHLHRVPCVPRNIQQQVHELCEAPQISNLQPPTLTTFVILLTIRQKRIKPSRSRPVNRCIKLY